MNQFAHKVERGFVTGCGAVTALFGCAGLMGWLLHIPILVQIWPAFSAMQFNAALGLVALGIGLVGLNRGSKFAGAAGLAAGLIGAATLIEYGLRVNLGIDQALFHPWLMAEVPGRMAVNTAVCLLLGGSAIFWTTLCERACAAAALAGGYCVFVIAGSALTGYGIAIEEAYRWAGGTRVAVPTALALFALGAGLCKLGWSRLTLNKTLWLTVLSAGFVFGISLLAWAAVLSQYRRMNAPLAVPDVMLFTAFTRTCIVAIAVFLWRKGRERLEGLNSNLKDKVTERTAQLDAIFSAVRTGTWSYDAATCQCHFHGRTIEIFGLPADGSEPGVDQILERIFPEDRDSLFRAFQDAVDGAYGNVDLEVRVPAPDGSTRWVMIQAAATSVVSGQSGAKPPADFSGIVLDVTRLKNTESALQHSEAAVRKLNEELQKRVRMQSEELRENEKRFRLMVEGLRDYAFFMLDTQGRIISWNLGAERITGHKADEIMGRNFSILSTEEEVLGGNPAEELQLTAEHGRFEKTGWRVRRDGSRFWVHVVTTAVYDEAGQLCGFSKLIRDITERRQAREQLELQKRRAEESNQAKSRFLASMSHEIRTPMNAILGMADLLWETNLDDEQRHFVEIFRSAGANLMQLINDILDLSKIESGRVELEKVAFDVKQVVDSTVELLAPKAQEKGVALRAEFAPGVATQVAGDPARLRQILVNLVGNAIKFTSSGEVVISAGNSESGVPGEVSFAVTDTGIGIPADKLATIFEAFAQVDASTTRKYGGTGLGLAISRRLVECMGGSLRAESELGRGSKFSFVARFESRAPTVDVTAPKEEPAVATHPALPRTAIARPARLLVAEDSLDNQFVVEAYLKNSRYAPTFVADGAAAVKQFTQAPFDAILMDMEMPVMNGIQATRAIRQIEAVEDLPPIPVLALTANAHRDSAEACLAAGCTSHVSKPVSKAGLLRALDELLNSPQAQERLARVAKRGRTEVSVPEGLEELAPRYLSARRKELPEMVALLAASEFEQIGARGHDMKGNGRSYGFPDLTDIGAALERFAQQKDKDALDKQLMRLANYLESVRVGDKPAAAWAGSGKLDAGDYQLR